MSHLLEPAIVRVFATGGQVIGTGCVLLPGHIVTCAHVITAALGLETMPPEKPDVPVTFDVPFVPGGQKLHAEVVTWDIGKDIAGLHVFEPLPDGTIPCLPQHGETLWGHRFRTFGFSENGGVWVYGKLLEHEVSGRLQIEVDHITGYSVMPGFSGAPVWDDELGGIIGIITIADSRDPIRTAFIIPTQQLFEVWPELAQAQRNAAIEQKKIQRDVAKELSHTPFHASDLQSSEILPEAEGEVLIVISAFHHSEGVIDTEPHRKIHHAIEAASAKAGFTNLRVAVTLTHLTADDRDSAQALADRYNASIVIWGEDTGVEVRVNFYNRKHPNFDAARVALRETSRTQIAEPNKYAVFISQDLPSQLTFLSFFALSQSYYAEMAYIKSVQALEVAVARLKGSSLTSFAADAYFRIGWLYNTLLSNTVKALDNYSRALQLNPQLTEAYINRGGIYHGREEYAKALSDYTYALNLKPGFALIYYDRGLTYYHMGEYPKALADYTYALNINSKYADAYNNRGNTYRAMGKRSKALADYTCAIEFNPQLSEAYVNRGTLYVQMSKYVKARADYTRAIELNPQDAEMYAARGATYAATHEYNLALADYTHALKLNPKFINVYYNQGLAHYKMGNYTKAISDYTHVLELNQQDAIAYFKRGKTYLAMGKYTKAIVDFARAFTTKKKTYE